LFLPDDAATYNFESGGVRRDNVRIALAHDSLVRNFIQVAAERNAILSSVPGIGQTEIEGKAAQLYERSCEQAALLETQLGMKYTPQNALCFCGSGQKVQTLSWGAEEAEEQAMISYLKANWTNCKCKSISLLKRNGCPTRP